MRPLILTAVLLTFTVPAYAADAPAPQIKPTDTFTVTLPAAQWNALVQGTDSKSLSNEIVRQIQEQFAKQHPAKK